MEQNKETLNFGGSQFFSIFILSCWVFFISFSSIKKGTPEIAIFASFIPVAIVASCFWFDYLKSGLALFICTLTLFTFGGLGLKYCQYISVQKKEIRKYKKSKYKFKKLKKMLKKYQSTYYEYPNPTTSGNKLTALQGSNTLHKVLARKSHGRRFYNRFPDAYSIKGIDASFVCVVTKQEHYRTNQFKYQNCITDHNTELPQLYKQGYVYHPASGKIRHNFRVKRPRFRKGFWNFVNHLIFSK